MANYKFLEYIQSSGTQYINTGFKPNQDTSVIMDIELSNSNTQALFGARTSTTSKTFCNFWLTAGYYRIHYNDGYTKLENGPTDPTIRQIIKHEKNILTIVNASISRTYTAFQCAYNLALLAVNGAGTISYYSSAKLYSCQIYDNDVIIRDFHPAKRLADNAIGLYDSINNVFYTNAGTGTFTAGPELSIENFYACDYIESTGTQYIDTRIYGHTKLNTFLDCTLMDISGNTGILGVRDNNNIVCAPVHLYNNRWYYGYTDFIDTGVAPVINTRYKINSQVYNGEQYLSINGNKIYQATNTTVFDNNLTLYLFGFNLTGNFFGPAKMKLYSCQLYNNNTLVRNFQPFCNEDLSLIGLYDSVTDSYFMNSGTGSFKMSGSLKPLTATSTEEPEERTILYLGDTKADQIYANDLPVDGWVDTSDATVTPEVLAAGVTAHDANGNKIVGTLNVSQEPLKTCYLTTGWFTNSKQVMLEHRPALTLMQYINGEIQWTSVPYSTDSTATRVFNNVVCNSYIYYFDTYPQSIVNCTPIDSGYFGATPRVYQITAEEGGGARLVGWTCFVKNTLITLENKEQKFIQNINYNDKLLVWDFDNGQYSSAYPLWIKKEEQATYYYKCIFSNGAILKLVGNNGNCHRVFCLDTNRFEYANNCVGKAVMTKNGPTVLLSCEKVEEIVEFYNVITEYHMNLFANNILTSTGLNNIYPIQSMKFIKNNNLYSELNLLNCPTNYYNGLRLAEQKNNYSIEELQNKINIINNLAIPKGEEDK